MAKRRSTTEAGEKKCMKKKITFDALAEDGLNGTHILVNAEQQNCHFGSDTKIKILK